MHNLNEGHVCMEDSSSEFNTGMASTFQSFLKEKQYLRKTLKEKLFKKQTGLATIFCC